MSDTSINKETSSTEPNTITRLQEVQTKSQGSKSHFEATELMPTEFEGPKPQTDHPESQVEIQEEDNAINSKGKEPILAKYVRRHHTPDQIIGDKLEGTMIRSKLKGKCLLADFEPRSVKDALENESWIEAMNEEIE